MAINLSFILLAHEDPITLRPLLISLLSSGSNVFLHYDAKQSSSFEVAVAELGLDHHNGKLFIVDSIKVSWGEWSIVQATLNCLKFARHINDNADYYILLSGSCMPIKPISLFKEFLGVKKSFDFIESVDMTKESWSIAGSNKYRYEFFHIFNWRRFPKLFDFSLYIQRKLGIKRSMPLGHKAFEGSQWWCLRAQTVQDILDFLASSPKIIRFYRSVWIPDEIFFQTIVQSIVPSHQIRQDIPMHYEFNSLGVPRVFYNDSFEELLYINKFFARKISGFAIDLKNKFLDISKKSIIDFNQIVKSEDNIKRLNDKFNLIERSNQISWFSLANSEENVYDYIKSIPNRIIVVIGSNILIRKKVVGLFSQIKDITSDGDFFEAINNESRTVMGHQSESLDKKSYPWHLFLGDLAIHNDNKLIVFSLGDDAIDFLNILRWKKDLEIICMNIPRVKEQTVLNSIKNVRAYNNCTTNSDFILETVKSWESGTNYYCKIHNMEKLGIGAIREIYNSVHKSNADIHD